eukprot:TRINITY_DN714_c0_g1_i2.p1 TRINITY_DN714_c0_g1~~TRINITY_DN714_c0_g1_i2.p1  ORF type:complete len:131 (-),score=54.41 TRINITY_DN714_c0_g1_i2:374-766(-)
MDNFISGAASLIHEVDKKVLFVFRDGRVFYGILRSFDQFANLVIESCCERIIIDNCYADYDLGTLIVRGENIVLIGEMSGKENENLQKADLDKIMNAYRIQLDLKEQQSKERRKLLMRRGMCLEQCFEEV